MPEKLYVCTNERCTLGSRDTHGVFTGGMTPQGRALLTGEPEDQQKKGKHHGEGICPNCGEPGQPYDPVKMREESIRAQIKALQAELKGGGD